MLSNVLVMCSKKAREMEKYKAKP